MDAETTSSRTQPGIRGVEAVTFFVQDLEQGKAFYRDALQLEPEEEEEDFASYRAGAVAVQLHPAGEPHPGVVLGRSGTGVPVQITFEVADVDAAIEHVRRLGVVVFDEPKDRPWGKRDAGVFDPEGERDLFLTVPRLVQRAISVGTTATKPYKKS